MAGFLSGLLKGSVVAKQGWNAGEAMHRQEQSEADKQAMAQQVMMARLYFEDQAKKRLQANSDRDYDLRRQEAGWVPGTSPSASVTPGSARPGVLPTLGNFKPGTFAGQLPSVSLDTGTPGRFDAAQSKTGREFLMQRQAQQGERETEIRAWNAAQPPSKQLPESKIKLYSSSPTMYGAWAKQAAEIDPITNFEKKRDYTVAHPLPSRAGPHAGRASNPLAPVKSSLGVVQKQLSESRSDLHRAESAVAVPPLAFRNIADSLRFEAKKKAATDLQSRVDSLSGVRDELGNRIQQKKPPAGPPVAKQPITQAEAQALRGQGFSDAQIQEKFVVRGAR